MEKYKLILGLGLSAKIFAFYNREYSIIGTENKQMLSGISQKLMFLQENDYNKQFLADLMRISKTNIPYSIKAIDVLTYANKTFKTNVSEQEKLNIIKKKLTDNHNTNLKFEKSIFADTIVLSEEKQSMLRIIEIDFSAIDKALMMVIQPQILSTEKIIQITPDIVRTENNSYAYSNIVNTIPYHVFHRLVKGYMPEVRTLDTTIRQGTEQELGVEVIPYETAIVYYPDPEYQFSKIVKRNGVCYAEITGAVGGGELIRNSRLIKTTVPDFPNVIMLGRFAEWDPDIKIQDVVRRSSNKLMMQRIWKDQRAFSGKYFDFAQDIELVQKNIKDMSLLLNGKSYDLLNTINWKRHKQQHKLDVNLVKQEWIAIFKYWLSIGINLNLSYEEFIDAYVKENERINE